MAERVIDEDRPRWLPGAQDVLRTAQTEGGNAMCFEMSCNQTHGLMTHRSHGNQQRSLHACSLHALQNRRCGPLPHAAL